VKNYSNPTTGGIELVAMATAAQAQSDTPDATVETAETKSDADAEIEFLKAQVDALQAQVTQLSDRVGKDRASWKGAPSGSTSQRAGASSPRACCSSTPAMSAYRAT